ncbi:LysE family translocator [Arcobacter sp. s6]|uniref:LysE family translocator n=1 Tax=Arcobacter sp. s6 TaxID=3230363 RepID=UPI0034A0627C
MELQIYLQDFLILVFAHFMALISPGVDFFIIINSTLKYGRKAGFMSAFGISIANLIYILLALFGITIIKENIYVFNSLKILGSLYLFFISYYLIQSKKRDLFNKHIKYENANNLFDSFIKGFISAVLNPKNFIFYFTMFSITIEKSTPFSIQIIYALWMFFAVLIWDIFIVYIISLEKIKKVFNKYIDLIEKISALFLSFIACIIIYKL